MNNNKRLFYALWPDPRQRDRLRDFISPVAKLVEGRAIDRRNWHVTLAYIGEFPVQRIPELEARIRKIEMQPFRLTFDRLEFWARPKVAALVAATVPAELKHFVLSVNVALEELGIETEDRTYRPHVTVARQARPFETQRLAQRSIIEWSGFELIESVSEPGGVGYRVLNQ
jgi:2'-5' RNA ligase